MTRAIDLDLTPAGHPDLTISTYTYDAGTVDFDSMAECVSLALSAGVIHALAHLTPDEARVLANQLLQVADHCEEARLRRESFDAISDELRDLDHETGPCVHYAHPDVHYVPAGQVAAKLRKLEAAGVRRYMVFAEPEAQEAQAVAA